MYTLKQISILYNIALETLRKRAYLLKIEPIDKIKKAYLYSTDQVYQIVEYNSFKNSRDIIYINRTFKETITEVYYIIPSKMNYGI